MKLAITGKGGVGKTTVTALLARALADTGRRVLAVDADPNATLASTLGFPAPEAIAPLTEMADLIEERTGVRPGTQGAVFKLNPRVDDIPARFAVEHDGVRLLRMGAVKSGGAGCYCPENAFLKSLTAHLFLKENDVLLMDMEAGVEHLGRGTVAAVDRLLIVTVPSRQGTATANRIRALAGDIGLTQLGVIGNMSRSDDEAAFLAEAVAPTPVLGVLPYDDGLRLAEMQGRTPEASSPEVVRQIEGVIEKLTQQAPR